MAVYASFGFLLLILSPVLGVENLKNIVNHLHDTFGVPKNQYALGISVPERYCNEISDLDQNFLSQNDPQNVKNVMQSKEPVYIGTQLIGARPKYKKHQADIHAEYLLLRDTKPSHMQNLLNQPDGGCTVFLTMNSPCVDKCSSATGPSSIIPGLKIFTDYKGPKAFVFRQMSRRDDPAQWKSNLRELDKRIPVYRCETNECVKCVDKNTVNPQCIAKADQRKVED